MKLVVLHHVPRALDSTTPRQQHSKTATPQHSNTALRQSVSRSQSTGTLSRPIEPWRGRTHAGTVQ